MHLKDFRTIDFTQRLLIEQDIQLTIEDSLDFMGTLKDFIMNRAEPMFEAFVRRDGIKPYETHAFELCAATLARRYQTKRDDDNIGIVEHHDTNEEEDFGTFINLFLV